MNLHEDNLCVARLFARSLARFSARFTIRMGKRINNQTTFVLRRANFPTFVSPLGISVYNIPPRPSLSRHPCSLVFIAAAKIKWQNGDDAPYFVHYSLPLHSLLSPLSRLPFFLPFYLLLSWHRLLPTLFPSSISLRRVLFFSVPCLVSSSGGIDRNPEAENAIGTRHLSRTLSVCVLQRESEA